MTKEIEFIGVGKMGGPMAGRLVDAVYRVHVFDLRKEAIAAIVSKGGVARRSPADVASKAETVLVSLPTPDIVKQVVLGDERRCRGNQGEDLRGPFDHRSERRGRGRGGTRGEGNHHARRAGERRRRRRPEGDARGHGVGSAQYSATSCGRCSKSSASISISATSRAWAS